MARYLRTGIVTPALILIKVMKHYSTFQKQGHKFKRLHYIALNGYIYGGVPSGAAEQLTKSCLLLTLTSSCNITRLLARQGKNDPRWKPYEQFLRNFTQDMKILKHRSAFRLINSWVMIFWSYSKLSRSLRGITIDFPSWFSTVFRNDDTVIGDASPFKISS